MACAAGSNVVNTDICRRLPKVELHAHLTGSISPGTLHEIWQQRKAQDAALELDDPLTVMSVDKEHFNVNTFFPLFDNYVYRLVDSVSSIKFSTIAVLQNFLEDGVRYVELRTTPRAIEKASITKEQYVSTVLDCIDEFVSSTENAMPTYLILSIDRRQTPEEAMATVRLAASLREQRRRVVGVDLCGNPARPINDLQAAFALAKRAGLKITLHFAETPSSSSRVELETLLSYEPHRLGHVIHVPQDLRARVVAAGIGVELCLSCNVLAGLTGGGFEGHHFREWRGMGGLIALSTDDVGVFRSPLSNEYLLAAHHFNLSCSEVTALVRSACDVIFADDHERRRMHRLLEDFAHNSDWQA